MVITKASLTRTIKRVGIRAALTSAMKSVRISGAARAVKKIEAAGKTAILGRGFTSKERKSIRRRARDPKTPVTPEPTKVVAVTRPTEEGSITVTRGGRVTETDTRGKTIRQYQATPASAQEFIKQAEAQRVKSSLFYAVHPKTGRQIPISKGLYGKIEKARKAEERFEAIRKVVEEITPPPKPRARGIDLIRQEIRTFVAKDIPSAPGKMWKVIKKDGIFRAAKAVGLGLKDTIVDYGTRLARGTRDILAGNFLTLQAAGAYHIPGINKNIITLQTDLRKADKKIKRGQTLTKAEVNKIKTDASKYKQSFSKLKRKENFDILSSKAKQYLRTEDAKLTTAVGLIVTAALVAPAISPAVAKVTAVSLKGLEIAVVGSETVRFVKNPTPYNFGRLSFFLIPTGISILKKLKRISGKFKINTKSLKGVKAKLIKIKSSTGRLLKRAKRLRDGKAINVAKKRLEALNQANKEVAYALKHPEIIKGKFAVKRHLRNLRVIKNQYKVGVLKKSQPHADKLFEELVKIKRAVRKIKRIKIRPERLRLEKTRILLRKQAKIELKIKKGLSVKAPRPGEGVIRKGKIVYPFQDKVTGKIRYFTSRKLWLRAVKMQVKVELKKVPDIAGFFKRADKAKRVLVSKTLKVKMIKDGFKLIDKKGKVVFSVRRKPPVAPPPTPPRPPPKIPPTIKEVRVGRGLVQLQKLKPQLTKKVKLIDTGIKQVTIQKQKFLNEVSLLTVSQFKGRLSNILSRALRIVNRLEVLSRQKLKLGQRFKSLRLPKIIQDILPVQKIKQELIRIQRQKLDIRTKVGTVTQLAEVLIPAIVTTTILTLPKVTLKRPPIKLPKDKILTKKMIEIIKRKMKLMRMIFIPDLYSIVYGIKASPKEKKEFLRAGRVFSGAELRKTIGIPITELIRRA